MIPYFSFYKIVIGSITLYTWGFFLALALLLGYVFVLKKTKKEGVNPDLIHNSAVLVILGAVIGSRIAYIFHSPAYYFSNPIEILKIWQGGLTIHGGIIGALIFVLIYVIWIKKIPKKIIWKIADSVALIMPLSIAIGRIGCSLINDHQGAETFLPWGIVWLDGIIRHPVAEYLIIANLVIFFILRFLKPKLARPGQLSFTFLLLYSCSRFSLDFTRSVGTPLSDIHYWGLSTAQWLSLVVILGIIIVEGRYFRKK